MKKFIKYIYDELPDDENGEYSKNEHREDYNKVRFRLMVLILSIILLVIGLQYLNPKTLIFIFIVVIYLYFLIYGKDLFYEKILFSYKRKLLKQYYKSNNQRVDENINGNDDYEIQFKYIYITNNGKIIGIFEILIYAFSILSGYYGIIPFLLGLRSLISFTSHPNKEEAEFYLLGLIGNLFFSVLITFIFVLAMKNIMGIEVVIEFGKLLNI